MSRPPGVGHIAPHVVVVLVVGVLVVGALVSPAWPQAQSQSSRSVSDDPRAVALLYRAMSAPARVSFTGTQYVSAWSTLDRGESTSAVVDVRHTAGGPTVVTGHGKSRTPVPIWHDGDSWLGGSGGPVGLLVKAYDVRVAGQANIAGRITDVITAHRPDGSTAAQLWLDAQHALPLRREVYDRDGQTVSASSFVEIEVVSTLRSRFSSSTAMMSDETAGDTARTALSHADLAELRQEGWLCPTTLDGGLVLYEAHRHADAVQLSYSDGVATLSVFAQQGLLDPAELDGFVPRKDGDDVVYVAPGPPSQFVWATENGRVITVVADGPLESVDAVEAAFPPSQAQRPDGLIERIGRGAKRLVSWLNPFD